MFPKKLMDACQLAVMVLTIIYLTYSIYTTYDRRKQDKAKLSA